MKSPGKKRSSTEKRGAERKPAKSSDRRNEDSTGSKSFSPKPNFKKNYSNEEKTGSRKPRRSFDNDFKDEERTGGKRPSKPSFRDDESKGRKPFADKKYSNNERAGGFKKPNQSYNEKYSNEERTGGERPARPSFRDNENKGKKPFTDKKYSNDERAGGFKKPNRSYNEKYSNEERTGGERAKRNDFSKERKGSFQDKSPRGESGKRGFDNDRRESNYRPGAKASSRESYKRDDEDKQFENKGYSKKKVLAYRKKHEDEGLVRLNKYIANSGICSRREADTHIAAGIVTVNGKTITELGYKVAPGDVVKYDGQVIKKEKPVYLLLNKPKDYITTLDDPGNRKTVMDLIKGAVKERVYPVGRLDRNTTGLLLFTNDGDMAKKLTHPKHGVQKIYHVELDKAVKKSDMEQMLQGVELEDGQVVVDEVSYVEAASKKEVGVVLHSGKNRIVRRIFEHFGYKVEKLDRVAFASLDKKNLPRGKWRILSEKEVNLLKMSIK